MSKLYAEWNLMNYQYTKKLIHCIITAHHLHVNEYRVRKCESAEKGGTALLGSMNCKLEQSCTSLQLHSLSRLDAIPISSHDFIVEVLN